ncbi:RICIN domain-containing protein [Allokutzneria sp. A3M-2-11 16]|uniref:RICIN domain-containing protein n=1 Tax=Allokutzneria sp. A3M-2-11 16 TaxID=2962043 RepID=UPI00273A5BD2|nr:RICIN domain-containing protein [Allokutzneria sp. A3M-2-11 16]
MSHTRRLLTIASVFILSLVSPITEYGDVRDAAHETPSAVPLAGPRPAFAAPWPCNQVRDYYHHATEVSNALDFNIAGTADLGTPALASAPGRVVSARVNGGYGNEVVVDHGGGWSSRVAHLSRFSVGLGQQVARGQELGKVGSTGNSTGPHLHYEQIADGVRVRIVIDGVALPYSQATRQHTSRNCVNGPLRDGTYRIRAEIGGHDLDVFECRTNDGADVRIWYRIASSPCQRWQVTSVGGSTFKIVDGNSGKALDVAGCSTANGAVVHLWPYYGGACQQWRIEPSGTSYSVIGVGSGKSLDVAQCSPAPGADVHLWPYHGEACQRWHFDPV